MQSCPECGVDYYNLVLSERVRNSVVGFSTNPPVPKIRIDDEGKELSRDSCLIFECTCGCKFWYHISQRTPSAADQFPNWPDEKPPK